MCNERRPAVETTPRFKREASRADEAEPRSMRVVSSKGVRGGKEVGRGALESFCADREERWTGHGEGGQRCVWTCVNPCGILVACDVDGQERARV